MASLIIRYGDIVASLVCIYCSEGKNLKIFNKPQNSSFLCNSNQQPSSVLKCPNWMNQHLSCNLNINSPPKCICTCIRLCHIIQLSSAYIETTVSVFTTHKLFFFKKIKLRIILEKEKVLCPLFI